MFGEFRWDGAICFNTLTFVAAPNWSDSGLFCVSDLQRVAEVFDSREPPPPKKKVLMFKMTVHNNRGGFVRFDVLD